MPRPGRLGRSGKESPEQGARALEVLGDRGREVLLGRLAAVNSASPEDYRRLDTLFHLAIAELTGSPLLAAACADARMRLNDL